MAQLSPSQLGSLAYQAGFRGSALTMATAIALAESSGNTDAYNPETAAGTPTGQGSYGLWQIYRNAHPEFSNVNLFDPAANAMAAFSVFRAAGNSFTPWSTYNNGTALQYAQQLQGVGFTVGGDGSSGGGGGTTPPTLIAGSYPTPGTTDTTGGVSSGGGASGGGGGLFNLSFNLLPQNVMDFLASPTTGARLVVGALGFVLIMFGLLMLMGLAGQSYTQNVQVPMAKAAYGTAKTGGLL